MTNLKVKECRKLRYIQFKKTIQFKNAFKTVLARSETEIKGFLCLTDVYEFRLLFFTLKHLLLTY